MTWPEAFAVVGGIFSLALLVRAWKGPFIAKSVTHNSTSSWNTTEHHHHGEEKPPPARPG